MGKPIVHYKELLACAVGGSAIVVPVDHPGQLVTNTQAVLTSQVLRFDPETGEFETRNTVYRPLGPLH